MQTSRQCSEQIPWRLVCDALCQPLNYSALTWRTILELKRLDLKNNLNDDAFAFIFPNGVVKHLKMNLKPTQNFSTGGIAFGSGIKKFFIGNWELFTFLMMGRVRWQNRPDNAFLRLLYTLLFSIAKTLACLSEAMKLFPYSYFVCLLVVSFNPIITGHRQSCFENATNILVWPSEHQPRATKLP